MLHILFASICFFVAGGWIEVHVLYTEVSPSLAPSFPFSFSFVSGSQT
jgi:hypothetical protein